MKVTYTGLAEKVHHGCGVATVRDLRLVVVEPASKQRRGRPRKEKAPAKVWAGACTACGGLRLFAGKPPEQLGLAAIAESTGRELAAAP